MSLTAEAYQSVIPALAIWREARGEVYVAKLGVAWVIRNRANDERRWPTDPAEVVTQPRQFAAFNRSDQNSTKWPRADDESWEDSCIAWESHEPDPTGGANHYHSYRNPKYYPKWAKSSKLTAEIGAFKFYRF